MKSVAFVALAALSLLWSAVPAHAGDGVKSLKLLPSDTNIVFNINVKRLRGGKAYDEIIAQLRQRGSFKDTEAALKKAGVNLKSDVDTVTMGLRGTGSGDPEGIVVVVEGRFKEAKIVASLKADNADFKKKSHKSLDYYLLGDTGALTFLGKTLVLAEAERIEGVIEAHKGGGKSSAAKSRAIKGMMSRTDTKKDVWFVAEVKQPSGGFGVPMADKLKDLVGSLDLVGGLSLRMRIGFSDTQSPKDVVSQLAALKPMAGGFPEVKKLGLDVVIDKTQLVADEKDVLVTLDLTVEEAERLKGLAESMSGAI